MQSIITILEEPFDQVNVELICLFDPLAERDKIDSDERLFWIVQRRELAHCLEACVEAEDLFAGELARCNRLLHDISRLRHVFPFGVDVLQYLMRLLLVR